MTAEMMGELRQTVNRFKLGAFEVITILEGTFPRDAVKPPFCMDKSEDEIAAIAAGGPVPADRFEHTFTCTLVNTGAELVLIDVGFGGNGGPPTASKLQERMAEAGYAPGDVDVVALTHAHPDHIAGLMKDGAPAFPNARYAIGRVEYEAWESGADIPEERAENRDLFLKLLPPLKEKLTLLEDGDTLVPGITAEAAFGHALGHMMFRVRSGDAEVLVWGDVANHYVFSLMAPEAVVAFDDDKEAGIATRKRVLAMVADAGTLVVGFHMPFPAVGHVVRSGESFRWVPASYQTRV